MVLNYSGYYIIMQVSAKLQLQHQYYTCFLPLYFQGSFHGIRMDICFSNRCTFSDLCNSEIHAVASMINSSTIHVGLKTLFYIRDQCFYNSNLTRQSLLVSKGQIQKRLTYPKQDTYAKLKHLNPSQHFKPLIICHLTLKVRTFYPPPWFKEYVQSSTVAPPHNQVIQLLPSSSPDVTQKSAESSSAPGTTSTFFFQLTLHITHKIVQSRQKKKIEKLILNGQ